ncbi:MAG TPA: cardiolipin synthase [Candidatus Cloacimonadota bacterium]|nr:cardiolipin synthase [Candidatus Cloacimonadota bacterium]
MFSHKLWDAVALVLILLVVLTTLVSAVNLLLRGNLDSLFTDLTAKVINVVFGITIILIIMIMVMENSNPVHTLAWILVLVFLPVAGFILYLFFGRNWRKRRLFNRKGLRDALDLKDVIHLSGKNTPAAGSISHKLFSLLESNNKANLTLHNKVEIISDTTEAFKQICAAINNAKSHVHLEFFSVARDSTGNRLKELLLRKPAEGIEIRFIYDDVGSWKLGHRYKSELKKAGVQMAPFMPVWIPFLNSRLNYRNHRKLVIVDCFTAFFGGMNIGDQYLGQNRYFGYWRDTVVKIEGEGAVALQGIFLTDWYFVSKQNLLTSQYTDKFLPHSFRPEIDGAQTLIQIATSGPDTDQASILQVYFAAIANARQSIKITTPYLILNESLSMAFRTAALSGLEVQIILPSKADHFMVYWASRSYYEGLLAAGVRIYEYQNGFIHSKILIIDDELASIGTANMDMRSFNQNFELTAMIYDREVVAGAEAQFRTDLEHSREVIRSEFESRSALKRSTESICKLFSPLL